MKLDYKLILNVAIAILIMEVLRRVVLDKMLDKIPHLEEMFEAN